METSIVPTIIGYVGLGLGVALLVITALSSIVITKQKEATIIERFGKFRGVRSSGLTFKAPFIDRKAYVQSLRIGQLEVKVETITKDKVSVHMKVAVQYYVRNSEESIKNSVYELSNFDEQIKSYVFNEIRAEVPKKNLDEVYESKEDIEKAVMTQLSESIEKYGYVIQNALVIDIDPDSKVKEAMNRINAATRDRKAAEEEGEANKIRLVKAAEAEAESKKLQGEGIAKQREAIIGGFNKSVAEFSKQTGLKEQEVLQFVLATQYCDTMREMAQHNPNVIFMPHSPSGAGIAESIMASDMATKKVLKG